MNRREAVQRVAVVVGASLSLPRVEAALAKGAAALATTNYAPRALSPEQLEQVATIAEHIIPATDTPGARAAGVHRFIDTMLGEYYTAEERQRFIAGLADVDVRARHSHGRAFLSCSEREQRALLEQLDRDSFARPMLAGAVPNEASRETERGGGGLAAASVDSSHVRKGPNDLSTFLRVMKELTLLGYYTSQPGATKELRYAQVPGRFEGCVPLAKVGRTWAT